jgi:hypothetical protein
VTELEAGDFLPAHVAATAPWEHKVLNLQPGRSLFCTTSSRDATGVRVLCDIRAGMVFLASRSVIPRRLGGNGA